MIRKKNKKDQQKPRPPKTNLMAGMPRRRPTDFHGLLQFLEQARTYPILGCWLMKGWQEQGITPVVVARQQAENRVVFGVFLVDIFCLGVKDAMWKVDVSLKQFERNLPRMCSDAPEPCDCDLAHELIYGALGYARKYGFEPHRDFAKASLVLDPPDTHTPRHDLDFGQDGKPLFIAGPYDNPRAIISQLQRTAGEGNFNYVAMLGDLGDFDELDED